MKRKAEAVSMYEVGMWLVSFEIIGSHLTTTVRCQKVGGWSLRGVRGMSR